MLPMRKGILLVLPFAFYVFLSSFHNFPQRLTKPQTRRKIDKKHIGACLYSKRLPSLRGAYRSASFRALKFFRFAYGKAVNALSEFFLQSVEHGVPHADAK